MDNDKPKRSKPVCFNHDEMERLITDWSSLATQHRQQGAVHEAVRLERLAGQMRCILDAGQCSVKEAKAILVRNLR